MFHIDQDQPKVIYTAEESSGIYRIDLRTGQSEKIFHHGTQVYRAFSRANPFFKSVPQWSDPGSVKAILQNHTYSAPHLIVGGQGYTVGLLDLRLASSSEMRMSDGRTGGGGHGRGRVADLDHVKGLAGEDVIDLDLVADDDAVEGLTSSGRARQNRDPRSSD